jgi:type VI secretion system protein ImpF
MAQLHKRQDILPTLFDRLIDEEPYSSNESADAYTISKKDLKYIVQRDLSFLLNTTNYDKEIDWTYHNQVQNSVLNYGIPPLMGGYFNDITWENLEEKLRTTILFFEPRIIPESLELKLLSNHKGTIKDYNIVNFEIFGKIHALPYPIAFTIQSMIDLESNRVSLNKE